MADLNRYIENLEKHRISKSQLTDEDLRQLALELGYTEEDLQSIEDATQAHIARGQNFLQNQLLTDAILEFKEALSLKPNSPLILVGLAQSYLGQWQADKQSPDKLQAEHFARQALAIDPNQHEAYAVIRALGLKAEGRSSAPIVAIAAAMAVVVAGAIGASTFMLVSDDSSGAPVSSGPDPSLVTDVTSETQEDQTTPNKAKLAAGQLPVELHMPDGLGLVLEIRDSTQDNYPDNSFYKYSYLLTNRGDKEIKEMKGRIELLDASGEAVALHQAYIMGTHDSKLRPGDSHGFSSTLKSSPDVKGVRLYVDSAPTQPAAKNYPPGKPVQIYWDTPQSNKAAFSAKERNLRIDDASKNLAFFRGDWEIQNTSGQTFELVRFNIVLKGPDGKEVDRVNRYLLGGSDPYFADGETRLLSTTNQLKSPVTSYELHVVEVQ